MKCPICGHLDTRVIDSRPVEGGVALRRRRSCDHCDNRFTTHERVAIFPFFVIKKDGRREEFQVEKLRNGVANACNKRPIPVDSINQIVEEVEQSLRQEGKGEVDSYLIGEMVMERLFRLDQVAYVRFASVYQRFDDVKRFAQLLERMNRSAKRQKEVQDRRSSSASSQQLRHESAPPDLATSDVTSQELAVQQLSKENVEGLAHLEDSPSQAS
jgi:transcriptional repressor NrdR